MDAEPQPANQQPQYQQPVNQQPAGTGAQRSRLPYIGIVTVILILAVMGTLYLGHAGTGNIVTTTITAALQSTTATTAVTTTPNSSTTTLSSTTTTSVVTTTINESKLYPNAVASPILFGQASAAEASPNTVTPFKMFHGAGVLVDTSSVPNKVYVVDSGNNRILGYNGIGYCAAAKVPCTDNSDCLAQNAGNECIVNGTKAPDMVFGQPNLTTAACNGNDSIGIYGPAGANSLCLTGYPLLTNLAEYWERINIAVDGSGSLYMVDSWNNRVLKYNSPFSANKSDGKGDAVPDLVIGQDNFTGNIRNHGNVALGPVPHPTSNTLWLNIGNGINNDYVSTHGVSVDSQDNVWVADTFNDRVLRFPANSTTANLVIGQPNTATSATGAGCIDNAPLNELCTPTLAMVSPHDGDLYVLDERPTGFVGRILVYDPPFTNGMNASRVIIPKEPDGYVSFGPGNDQQYQFSATGFAFNPDQQGIYAQGVLWINDQYHRTILIDDQGDIIATIGSPNTVNVSAWGDSFPPCGQTIQEGFNLDWPGGSIGFDSDNNIYLADASNNRISRYALPYTPIRYINGTLCMPQPNGGLFPGYTDNQYANPQRLGQQLGAVVYQNQLIVYDEQGLVVWNNYTKQPTGVPPSFIVQRPAGMTDTQLISGAIDENGRLWLINQNGQFDVYQLPLHANDVPIASNLKIYWENYGLQGTPVSLSIGDDSTTFDIPNHEMYIVDEFNNRILRVSNYDDVFSHNGTNLTVDMVLGQTTKNGTACNEGNPGPSSTTLCVPHQLKFDNSGNMFVVENDYECHGNDRITVYSAQSLNAEYGFNLFPDIAASDVLIAPNLDSTGPCATVGIPGSPVSLAFDKKGDMVVGEDGYYGNEGESQRAPDITEMQRQYMQLWLYRDPLAVNATPNATIRLPMGNAGDLTFDTYNDLIAQDGTWNRLWVVNLDTDPGILGPT